MLIVIGIAGAAALAVIAYNAFKESQPEAAIMTTRRAQQLAAVVLVLSQAVQGVVEALAMGLRAEPAMAARPHRLVDVWDEEDYR